MTPPTTTFTLPRVWCICVITKTCLGKERGSYEKRKLLDSNNYYLKEQPPSGSNGSPHKNIEMQLEIILRILKKEQKSW